LEEILKHPNISSRDENHTVQDRKDTEVINTAEEKISELEDIAIEMILNEIEEKEFLTLRGHH
jgi:hypothetical protein